MKIFIVGSARELPEVKKREMESACYSLGSALAKDGHTLILGSDAQDTADAFVVDGVAAESDASSCRIYVYRKRDTDHRPFGDRGFSSDVLRVRDDFLEQTAAHAKSVQDADVVLLIGGHQKTLAAGYVAHALDKPYLPILCFGGNSAELWPDFEARYRLYRITDEEFEAVKWSCDPQAVVACCKKLEAAHRRLGNNDLERRDMAPAIAASEQVGKKPPVQAIRVFICHSSKDGSEAGRLIDLLRSALNLTAKEIRCSSVDGYRLPAGASVAERLKMEVHADVFVGLLSSQAMGSPWAVLELGARWGSGRSLIPLLTRDTRASDLKDLLGPIGELSALSAGQAGQLHQLVAEIGRGLGIRPENGSVYQEKIDLMAR